jgi:hypothetical protein
MGLCCSAADPILQPQLTYLGIRETKDTLFSCGCMHPSQSGKKYNVFFHNEETNKVHIFCVSFNQYRKKKFVSPSLEIIDVDYTPQEIETLVGWFAIDSVYGIGCKRKDGQGYFMMIHKPQFITEMVESKKKVDEIDP